MGEPEQEPLNLELLQGGDENEITRAICELGLMALARTTVSQRIARYYQFDVEEVANEAVRLLLCEAIHRVNDIAAIRPMLCVIANRKAITFLNNKSRRMERKYGQQLLEEHDHAVEADDPFTILGDVLAEGLGLEAFDLNQTVGILIEVCGLKATEEMLLKEHILGGMTQQEFSDKYGVPVRGVGGHKSRLLNKIRIHLSIRYPIFHDLLRRNHERG